MLAVAPGKGGPLKVRVAVLPLPGVQFGSISVRSSGSVSVTSIEVAGMLPWLMVLNKACVLDSGCLNGLNLVGGQIPCAHNSTI